ncbi:MAG TPA: hypothetical protein PKJ51_10640 [Methanothrix sp.]|nr:hypothetical protein [Methanothrix sp.]
MVDVLVKLDRARYVYLYLPSAEDKKRWENLATEAGDPLSNLTEESEIKPRREFVKQHGSLRDEIREFQEELKLKEIVLDEYDNELKNQSGDFLEDDFEGARKYSREPIEIPKCGDLVIEGGSSRSSI